MTQPQEVLGEVGHSIEVPLSPELAGREALSRLMAIGQDEVVLGTDESFAGLMHTVVQGMPGSERDKSADKLLSSAVRRAFTDGDGAVAEIPRAKALMAIALIGDRVRNLGTGDAVTARMVLYQTFVSYGRTEAATIVAGTGRKSSTVEVTSNRLIKKAHDAGWSGVDEDVLTAMNDTETPAESLLSLLPEVNRLEGKTRRPKAERNVGQVATKSVAESTEFDDPDYQPSAELDNPDLDRTDILGLYLKTALSKPLLNAEQEVDLSKRIEAGVLAETALADEAVFQQLVEDALEDWTLSGAMPAEIPEDERVRIVSELKAMLPLIAREGKSAKNLFIESNLRLVVSIAKRYKRRGMELIDRIQEGSIGLAHAVELFDYKKGYKFSTYATWWIQQAIVRAIANQGRGIRIPMHALDDINQTIRLQAELRDAGKDSSPEALATELGIPVAKVVKRLNDAKIPLSLQQTFGENDRLLGDMVADQSPDVFDIISPDLDRAAIDQALAVLSEREQAILRRRYGLHDGRPWTLDELGKFVGVTRERIRQIENKAIAKLRARGDLNSLREAS